MGYSEVFDADPDVPETAAKRTRRQFTPTELGSKVRRMRQKNEWTQTELARLAEVSQMCVSAWETGRCAPRLVNACRILRALKLGKTAARLEALYVDRKSGLIGGDDAVTDE